MKKYFYSMVVMAIFAIGFAASGDEGGSDERCGTYKIVDKSGSVFHLTLKEDESGTMTTESNEEISGIKAKDIHLTPVTLVFIPDYVMVIPDKDNTNN